MNNFYWGAGWTDGRYNFTPDLKDKRYSDEQEKLYWAGFRCGVRAQTSNDKKKYEATDQELKALDYKFPAKKGKM